MLCVSSIHYSCIHTALAQNLLLILVLVQSVSHYLFQFVIYEGWYKSIFFSETTITVIIKHTYIMHTSFTKFKWFFHKISFIISTLSSFALDALCLSCKTLCWSTVMPVTSVFSLLLKQWTQCITELTSMISSPYTHVRCLWNCVRLKPSALKNSVPSLCLSMYVHNVRLFAPLLCWKHLTDWNTNDSGGAGQCHYPRQESLSSSTFKKKIRRHYFYTNFHIN